MTQRLLPFRVSTTIAAGAAAALGALAVAAIWLLAVPLGPDACPWIDPGLRNCFDSERQTAAPGATLSVAVVAVVAVIVTLMSARSASRPVRATFAIVSIAAVVGVGAVSYVSVAWIPALA